MIGKKFEEMEANIVRKRAAKQYKTMAKKSGQNKYDWIMNNVRIVNKAIT